jgi:hypothetical protein
MPDVSLPSEQPSGTPPTERRAAVRHPCHLETFFQQDAESAGWGAGQIRDISLGGLGLVVVHRLEPGTGVVVGLPSKKAGLPRVVTGQVRHVRQQPDGAWAHGCAFATQLTERQLQELLS